VTSQPQGSTVVLYDGVCGLCNRLTRFLLRRDRHARIHFAALQSPVAQQALGRWGRHPSDLDTVYVIANWNTANERLLDRSRAFLHALTELDGVWRMIGRAGSVVPLPVADALYRMVARNRYRLFGKFESCTMPPPEWRQRFLDQHRE
jgi:predicted DCC family thiol-disulfide oxidoreductase YuxK